MTILFFLEMIGTVAFASSGAMVAIRKRLDLLGVIVLGVITAVGGGIMRDLLIGYTPPSSFRNPVYLVVATATVCLIFMIVHFSRRRIKEDDMIHYEKMLNVFDALGLGTFTVTGINTALSATAAKLDDYTLLLVFLGVITGVGGGVLRDILAMQTPYILHKHVYACASLLGAVCYVSIRNVASGGASMLISASVVVVIRLLAAHFQWNLPKALP